MVMRADGTELRLLRAELLDAHRELMRLRTQNGQLAASNKDLSALLASCTRHSGELLKTVVAFQGMFQGQAPADAVRALEDILVNVLGTEDFVILAVGEEAALSTIGGMGDSLARLRRSRLTLEQAQVATDRVVPLYLGERLVALIIIGALLAHRGPLGASDSQLMSVLSRFAARAIVAAGAQDRLPPLSLPA